MKIAISNLSWEPLEDEKIAKILSKYNIKGIEIAPTKIWKDPINVSQAQLKSYKTYWLRQGISIVATTSLLFGHPELTIFENNKTREKTQKYLFEMIRLSSALGAKVMVFGSPRNRQTHNLNKRDILKISKDFFFSIAELAKQHSIFFGIEPNPAYYGTDFINTTQEAIELVRLVDHPNFRLHMDSGAMAMNNEDYGKSIKQGISLTCHFHISEPMLKQINIGEVDHFAIAKILKTLNYDKWISIEMPLSGVLNHEKIIDETLKFVVSVYA